jgi:hypothetical protein
MSPGDLIISDYGEIKMPEWMAALWRERSHKLPPLWRGLPHRETQDGLRISFTEAYLLVKHASDA